MNMHTKQTMEDNGVESHSKTLTRFISSKLALHQIEKFEFDLGNSLSYDTNFCSILHGIIIETYEIINSDEPTVCWVRGGKAFLILDPKKFSQVRLASCLLSTDSAVLFLY